MVSEFEERAVALFGLYTWAVWQRLPRDERVHAVAHYRLTKLIDTHLTAQAKTAAERATTQ